MALEKHLHYSHFEKFYISTTESKHTPFLSKCEKVTKLKLLSKSVGYNFCELGSKKYISQNFSMYIEEIAMRDSNRPIKYVISKDGRIWCDNTHHALSVLHYVSVFTRIKDAPYYFIDLRPSIPTIYNKPNSLSAKGMSKTIDNALNIQYRIDKGWRPPKVKYTIGELYSEVYEFLSMTS